MSFEPMLHAEGCTLACTAAASDCRQRLREWALAFIEWIRAVELSTAVAWSLRRHGEPAEVRKLGVSLAKLEN